MHNYYRNYLDPSTESTYFDNQQHIAIQNYVYIQQAECCDQSLGIVRFVFWL